MLHTVFIALHAASGAIAFAAGCLVLVRRSYFPVYLGSLVALVVFLAAVVGVDWSGLGTASRALFIAFIALGGYMIWRAVQAGRLRLAGETRQRARFIDHIGFTLVALFVGFAIIAALDLGAPGWLAATVGGAGVALGHATLRHVKARSEPLPP